ncbi:MAG: hypothetical protein IK062_05720 [Selenomonadaceae bacterium]|nr:hypothetical protein [Selenomonadaceae bacterium]
MAVIVVTITRINFNESMKEILFDEKNLTVNFLCKEIYGYLKAAKII